MTPERAKQLYDAVQVLREFRKEAALIQPAVTLVSPVLGTASALVVELEPAAEMVLSAFFEVVNALERHQNPEDARASIAAKLRTEAQAELDKVFPNG